MDRFDVTATKYSYPTNQNVHAAIDINNSDKLNLMQSTATSTSYPKGSMDRSCKEMSSDNGTSTFPRYSNDTYDEFKYSPFNLYNNQKYIELERSDYIKSVNTNSNPNNPTTFLINKNNPIYYRTEQQSNLVETNPVDSGKCTPTTHLVLPNYIVNCEPKTNYDLVNTNATFPMLLARSDESLNLPFNSPVDGTNSFNKLPSRCSSYVANNQILFANNSDTTNTPNNRNSNGNGSNPNVNLLYPISSPITNLYTNNEPLYYNYNHGFNGYYEFSNYSMSFQNPSSNIGSNPMHQPMNPYESMATITGLCTNDIKPFKCQQCSQKFGRSHDLKRHLRIHLNLRPHCCSPCNRQFTRLDALTRHKLTKKCKLKASSIENAKTTTSS